jgi:hypothetical protein
MNIFDIATQAGLVYDRTLHSTLSLPYSGFDSIKIAQNDIATADVINNAFSKLYTNYLQLYRFTNIASNVIPISAVSFVNSPVQGDIVAITGVLNASVSPNYYVFFASTGTDIIALTADIAFTSVNIVASINTTASFSNISFVDVRKLIVDLPNNTLFVLDREANLIHKYNISGFTTNDRILKNKFVYLKSMGGIGGYDDSNFFNSPESFALSNSYLYIIDSGNSCIKVFDSEFNWVTTYRLFRDFYHNYPIDIATDNNNFYILTENSKLLTYTNTFVESTITDLPVLSGSGEIYESIVTSNSDSEIFYLISNTNVYKKFYTDITGLIGYYLFYRYGIDINNNVDQTIKAFATVASNETRDKNIVFSTINDTNTLGLYDDSINLVSNLVTDQFDIYSLSSINIGYDEYVQNWVFNKSIAKMIVNHIRLRNLIISRFLYEPDDAGTILLQGQRYLTPYELSTITYDQSITNFIGCNEIFQNNIINRELESIYTLQTSILDLLKADVQYAPNIEKPVVLGIESAEHAIIGGTAYSGVSGISATIQLSGNYVVAQQVALSAQPIVA